MGSALSPPWLHHDTTTLTRYGADAEDAPPSTGPVPPRPAYGDSTDGPEELTQVLLRLGVNREGLPRRMGGRDGPSRDSPETPGVLAECVARGRAGVRGMGADRQT